MLAVMPRPRTLPAHPQSDGFSALFAAKIADVGIGFFDQGETTLIQIPRWWFSLFGGSFSELLFPLSPFGHVVPFFGAS
jgi:hypothetical protein